MFLVQIKVLRRVHKPFCQVMVQFAKRSSFVTTIRLMIHHLIYDSSIPFNKEYPIHLPYRYKINTACDK